MRQVGLAAGIVRKLQMIRNADDISIKQEDKSVQCVCTNLLSSHLLLYNSEIWTLKEEHKRKLKVFKMSVLRKILGVT